MSNFVRIRRSEDYCRITEWVGVRNSSEIYVSSINVSYRLDKHSPDVIISDVEFTDKLEDAYKFNKSEEIETQAAIQLLDLYMFEAVEEDKLMGEYIITYETLGEFSHHETVHTALAELKDKGYKQEERSTARYYDDEGRLAVIDWNDTDE